MTETHDLEPWDEANQRLVSHVHPADWENPVAEGRYDLVVLGAGTAGLVTAAGAAGLGAKVALVEKNLMGGDCLNVGCVPSKALIGAARKWHQARKTLGVESPSVDVKQNFAKVMQRLREIRAEISPHDSAARFRDLGVDLYLGDGTFVSPNTVEVAGQAIRFKKGVIATGARAVALPIPGLGEVDYLTNENVFNLTELPERLAIIGGGPIGVELAQAFARLGSEVTLFEVAPQILIREDRDAARIVEQALVRDGVQVKTSASLTEIRQQDGVKEIKVRQGESEEILVFDQILLSVGRAPNVEGIGLETVGVEYDLKKGVQIDDRLRTTNKSIYAAGDVCSELKFTHAADFQARIVIQNSLFFGRAKVSALTIPWCTYTDPEIAHVGLYEQEALKQGIDVDTFLQEFKDVDRAVLEEETDGFIKIHTVKGKSRIVGATIVGPHAGDLISEISVAMKAGMGLDELSKVIHPYPTLAEGIRKVGDQYNRTRLTPFVRKLLGGILKIQR